MMQISTTILQTVGNMIIQHSLSLFFIYVLFVKDCFEIILWTFIKIRKRFAWILQKLFINDSWQVFLEEIGNDLQEPFFSESIDHKEIWKDCHCHKEIWKDCHCHKEMCLCQSCTKKNNSLMNSKFLKMKSPIKDITNSFLNQSFQSEKKFHALKNQNCQSPFLNFKGEPYNPNTLLRMQLKKDISESATQTDLSLNTVSRNLDHVFNFEPRQKQSFESIHRQKSPFNVNRRSFGFDTTACTNRGSKTFPKTLDMTTPLKKASYIDLESPICEVKFQSNRNRLDLMDTEEADLLPEKKSLLERSLNKWKEVVSHFKEKKDKRKSIFKPGPHSSGKENVKPPENEYYNRLPIFNTKFDGNPNRYSVIYKRF